MSKDKKVSGYSAVLGSLASCFNTSGEGKRVDVLKPKAAPCGPEATMVAAAKHFSSAHKVIVVILGLLCSGGSYVALPWGCSSS